MIDICCTGKIWPRCPPLTVWTDLWSDMDGQEFKVRGRQMVDYIIQYLEVKLLNTATKIKQI